MDKKQVLIIALLIVAVAFSLTSIIMNLSLRDFEKISVVEGVSAGGSAGSIGFNMEEPVSGGVEK